MIPGFEVGASIPERVVATLALVGAVVVARQVVRVATHGTLHEHHPRAEFWTGQVTRLLVLAAVFVGLAWIWFDDPGRLGSALGFIGAGVAVALQRVITAFAAYLVILRGNVFTVGDRITMGSVRGDVVDLGFMQTTVMEMGQSSAEQQDGPSIWVSGRQFTGRLVRITNDRIFDQPVYNFTREFPFIWEELRIGISYEQDYGRAERVLLDIGRRHTEELVRVAGPALEALMARIHLQERPALEPRVFYRLTDNWVELSLRFIARPHGVRALKDAMSRDLVAELKAAGLAIASATFEVVGLPPVRVDARVEGA